MLKLILVLQMSRVYKHDSISLAFGVLVIAAFSLKWLCEVLCGGFCGNRVFKVNIEVCCHFTSVVLCCLDTIPTA